MRDEEAPPMFRVPLALPVFFVLRCRQPKARIPSSTDKASGTRRVKSRAPK